MTGRNQEILDRWWTHLSLKRERTTFNITVRCSAPIELRSLPEVHTWTGKPGWGVRYLRLGKDRTEAIEYLLAKGTKRTKPRLHEGETTEMKTMKIAVKDLLGNEQGFDVRKNQSEDRVTAMEEAITSGDPNLKLPRVSKSPSGVWVVIDGRHTISAFHRLDPESTIEVQVIPWTSEKAMIAMAYKANTGGPLPPISADTVVTIGHLVRCGSTDTEILALLKGTHSARYLKEKIAWAKGHEKENKLRAADIYRNKHDCTKSQAAAAVGLKPDDYEKYLSRGAKNNKSNPLKKAQRRLSATNKSHSQKLRSIFKDVETAFEAGIVTDKKVAQLILDAKDYTVRLEDHCNQRLNRFKNAIKALKG